MALNTQKFEYYSKEANYVSPAEVSEETSQKIRNRNARLGKIASFGNL